MDDREARIREAIECCRPGSDDLGAPELAVLTEAVGQDADLRANFERIQEFDRRIAPSFRDLPVPAGLEERLLARLALDDAAPTGMTEIVDAATECPGESRPESISPDEKPDRAAPQASRRKRFPLAISASVAALLLVGVFTALYVFRPSDEPMDRDAFLDQAEAFIAAARQQRDWSPYPATAPPDRKFPNSKIVRQPIGWQRIEAESFDKRAIAYLIDDRIGSEVILLVIQSRQKVAGLKKHPPQESLPTSGQQSVGAWNSDDHLYVVLVRGHNHESRYRSLLEEPPTLALIPRKVLPSSLIGKL